MAEVPELEVLDVAAFDAELDVVVWVVDAAAVFDAAVVEVVVAEADLLVVALLAVAD